MARRRTYRVVRVTATEKTARPTDPWVVQGSGYYRSEWVDVARFSTETAARGYVDEVRARQYRLEVGR